MKKLILILTCFLAMGSLGAFADEQTAVWQRLYKNAFNDDMRYAILLNIRQLHDAQFGPMLSNALSDLDARQITLGSANEVEAKARLATELIQELGDLKVAEAADVIYHVYKETGSLPFLKAEAAMALGKIRATDYVPQLARDLSDLNLAPSGSQAQAQEIIAFGLVQGLASMKDARGYEPVFFASIGWYGPQRKVKETARAMLKSMVDDPTESLLSILKSQTVADRKLAALQAEADSNAPAEGKARVAKAALADGVETVASDIVDTTRWATLRKTALEVLVATKDHSADVVPTFRQEYKTATLAHDSIEVLSLLSAAGANGTPEAVAFLSELVDDFNNRVATPGLLTNFDVQQLRTILLAFKTAQSAAARPVLLQAQFAPYTPAVLRDIKATLAALPQQ